MTMEMENKRDEQDETRRDEMKQKKCKRRNKLSMRSEEKSR